MNILLCILCFTLVKAHSDSSASNNDIAGGLQNVRIQTYSAWKLFLVKLSASPASQNHQKTDHAPRIYLQKFPFLHPVQTEAIDFPRRSRTEVTTHDSRVQRESTHDSKAQGEGNHDSRAQREATHDSRAREAATHHLRTQSDATHNSRAQSDATHDSRAQREATHDPRAQREATHDPRAQREATHDSRAHIEATHDSRDSRVQKDATHDSRARSETTHDSRVQREETHDSRAQSETTHDSRTQREATHDSRVQIEAIHKSKAQREATHDSRKEKQSTHNSRRQTEQELTHDSRQGSEFTHDSRQQRELTHDSRQPTYYITNNVQSTYKKNNDSMLKRKTDQANNSRGEIKSLQDLKGKNKDFIEYEDFHTLRIKDNKTHDFKKLNASTYNSKIKLEPNRYIRTHNSRQPVALEESHDLRWPVMEEDTHDMRNFMRDIDLLADEFLDGYIHEMMKSLTAEEQKENIVFKKDYHKIRESLLEDEELETKCAIVDFGTANSGKRKDSQRNSSFETCGLLQDETNAKASLERNKSSKRWPWIVSLQQFFLNQFRHKCGASLINNLWVVTAAHCVNAQLKFDFRLQMSFEHIDNNGHHSRCTFERFVDKIAVHPKYNSLSLENDVALLKMDTPVELWPNIAPICLPDTFEQLEGKHAIAFGWHFVGEGKNSFSDDLHEFQVSVMSNDVCEEMYAKTEFKENISNNFICADQANESNYSCQGNSGAPLIIQDSRRRWSLVGLVSWGRVCGDANQPGVFTRISKYVDWIRHTIACYVN